MLCSILCNTDRETLNATTDRSAEDTAPLGDWGDDACFDGCVFTAPSAEEKKNAKKSRTETAAAPKLPAFNPFAVLFDAAAAAAAAASSASASAEAMSDVPSDAASAATAAASSPAASAAASTAAAAAAAAASSSSSSSGGSVVSQHFPSAWWSPPCAVEEFTFSASSVIGGGGGGRKGAPQATPPYFKRVSANQYGQFVAKPTRVAGEDAVEPCTCKEQNDKCEANCINRAVYQECTRKCPNGA
jgi:hypothetical protein